MFRFIQAAIFAVLLVQPAAADDYTAGALKIGHPWSRATPKGASIGGGYMKITNTGNTIDHLIGGASDVASRFEIHEMSMDNGVMKMRQITGGLEIKPGQTVELKPGGLHLMLVGLKAPLEKGGDVKATLQFEKAGAVTVDFKIEAIGAPGPDAAGGSHTMPGLHKNH